MTDQPNVAGAVGEPGTVAVTVEGRRAGGPPTYRADLAATPPKLRVADLSVTYVDRTGQRTEAVRDVSFDIADKPGSGEVVVFLGPSGCGKSTILKAVAGLLVIGGIGLLTDALIRMLSGVLFRWREKAA